jgi:hypothetical protein
MPQGGLAEAALFDLALPIALNQLASTALHAAHGRAILIHILAMDPLSGQHCRRDFKRCPRREKQGRSQV